MFLKVGMTRHHISIKKSCNLYSSSIILVIIQVIKLIKMRHVACVEKQDIYT